MRLAEAGVSIFRPWMAELRHARSNSCTQFGRGLGDKPALEARRSDKRQMVGPFIFFDQMGPSEFLLGAGMDVRPHPHIGLSTVTYLFDGEIMHRDSLGT